jgi:hypothetical protein
MTFWWFIAMLAVLGASAIAFIWLIIRLNRLSGMNGKMPGSREESMEGAAEQDVERIFNDEFREELRNRGRLHFEKIIGENAMFLQQVLRLTTSHLNVYMKNEITNKLKEEFAKYEESIMDAKQLAIESIQKTNQAIDEQRVALGEQLQTEIAEEKKQMLEHFSNNMAEVVSHYVVEAIGNQIDLTHQLDFIVNELETSKSAMLEDINSGA